MRNRVQRDGKKVTVEVWAVPARSLPNDGKWRLTWGDGAAAHTQDGGFRLQVEHTYKEDKVYKAKAFWQSADGSKKLEVPIEIRIGSQQNGAKVEGDEPKTDSSAEPAVEAREAAE